MKTYKCGACDKECDLHEQDDGGYEEVWGAKVWVEAWTDYTDCCSSEDYEEVEESEEPLSL